MSQIIKREFAVSFYVDDHYQLGGRSPIDDLFDKVAELCYIVSGDDYPITVTLINRGNGEPTTAQSQEITNGAARNESP